jgi:hypothetical protein
VGVVVEVLVAVAVADFIWHLLVLLLWQSLQAKPIQSLLVVAVRELAQSTGTSGS